MSGSYREPTISEVLAHKHTWEVRIVWAHSEWKIVGWHRQCRCGAGQPLLRSLRNTILDTFRIWGWYDREHKKLDGVLVYPSLHENYF